MLPSVRLSTEFVSQQNAHIVRMLISARGESPRKRAPINVALVLDRSGSMSGAPLATAKNAATHFASFLGKNDRVSVVVFDDVVECVAGPTFGGDPAIARAIGDIETRGSTNLAAGWLHGVNLVNSGLVAGTNRVVLFTDGVANQGITDVSQLVQLANAHAGDGVTTTCIGFGEHFNEDLLEAMARAGGGNYWYIENIGQMLDIFSSEIENLVSCVAHNLEFEVTLSHPRASEFAMHNNYPFTRIGHGPWRIMLGDLYATSPREVAITLRIDGADASGVTEIARVQIHADIVTERGIEHRVELLPIAVTLDSTSHVDPKVDLTFLQLQLAKAREDAIHSADGGHFSESAIILNCAMDLCMPHADDPSILEEIQDLRTQIGRISARKYTSADRKYQKAYIMGVRESKKAYVDKLRRK